MIYHTDENGKQWKVMDATEIYDLLVNDFKIKSLVGNVNFSIGQFTIKAKTRDIIGNLIENWVRDWLVSNNIWGKKNPNPQTAPDVFLLPGEDKTGWLEIKAFYKDANFDVADFIPFARDLSENIWQLDEDILIFQYDMNEETGDVQIVNVFLKKMWQICGYCEDHAIKLQAKNGQINKIRPVAWYSTNAEYKPFPSIETFLSAVKEQYFTCENNYALRSSWKIKVTRAYKEFFGRQITIPEFDALTECDKSFSVEKKQLKSKETDAKKAFAEIEKSLARDEKQFAKIEKTEDKLTNAKKKLEDKVSNAKQGTRKYVEGYEKLQQVTAELSSTITTKEECARYLAEQQVIYGERKEAYHKAAKEKQDYDDALQRAVEKCVY